MTPGDWPAAHSMDTEFFVVDKDGHVALFKSGEEGAVPVNALQDNDEVSVELRRLEATPPGVHESFGIVAPGEFVVRARRRDLEAGIAAGRARPEASRYGFAARYLDMTPEESRRLHELGACLGCAFLEDVIRYDPPRPTAAQLGLFVYQQPSEGIATAYEISRIPWHPVTVEDLPEKLRDLGRVRFSTLRFLDQARIQPAEHAVCKAYGCAWLHSDGIHVHPVPGREDEYAECVSNFDKTRYSCEPPRGA